MGRYYEPRWTSGFTGSQVIQPIFRGLNAEFEDESSPVQVGGHQPRWIRSFTNSISPSWDEESNSASQLVRSERPTLYVRCLMRH